MGSPTKRPANARVTVVAAEHAARIRVDDVLGVWKLGPYEDGLCLHLDHLHGSARPARHAAYDGCTVDKRFRREPEEPIAKTSYNGTASALLQGFELPF